jgi:uncharacterized membrane protein
MHFSIYIILFVIFSFIGFIIDSTYRSIFVEKKLVRSGYVSYLPLCPVYGFGGLALFIFQRSFGYLPEHLLVLIGLFLLLFIEYVGGVYCVYFIKERLWDYTEFRWNLHGHINLLHSVYWALIVHIFVNFLFPIFLSLEIQLRKVIVSNYFEELLFLGFSIFIFVLVSYLEFRKRQKARKV